MWFLTVIAIALVAFAGAQDVVTTTKATHQHGGHHQTNTTREPSEHASFKYVYEPITHHMLLINYHNCYVFTLTDAERVSVHTDAGIRALELKLLGLLGTGTVTQTTVDALDRHVSHSCGHHITNFYTVSQ